MDQFIQFEKKFYSILDPGCAFAPWVTGWPFSPNPFIIGAILNRLTQQAFQFNPKANLLEKNWHKQIKFKYCFFDENDS
ncbi:MAG: hypothetical protein D6814_08340 [Calditrichaeota bacterium]|nr:MAG: hypothetical protein D6814_08340 [Calditrichota bacterium]